jgi:hypothetical protein
MRKLIVLVVLGLVTGVLAVTAPAIGSSPAKYDAVVGIGQRAGFGDPATYTPTFVIAAKSGPSGANVKGTMTIDWGTSWVDAPFFGARYRTTVTVTNLCVTGDTATIVGYITSGTPNANVGDPLVTIVRDGGKGGKSDTMGGVFSGWGYFSDPLFSENHRSLDDVCHDPYPPHDPAIPALSLTSGNITVKDATP